MRAYLNKVQKDFFAQNPHLKDQPRRAEGEISIDHVPSRDTKSKKADDSGEYVDYQEIKD
jgi:hypothetical protein